MPLNPSWMELGLADRVQSQTHFMFSLPLVLPVQLSQPHHTGLSCSCSHSFPLLFQDHFWKDTEVKLVCFPASYSLLQDFVPPNSEGD